MPIRRVPFISDRNPPKGLNDIVASSFPESAALRMTINGENNSDKRVLVDAHPFGRPSMSWQPHPILNEFPAFITIYQILLSERANGISRFADVTFLAGNGVESFTRLHGGGGGA